MPRLIAFLRAINVGGHTVTMEELRGHFGALGFKDVETFIASGNVIFTSPVKDTVALQRRIEDRLRESLAIKDLRFVRALTRGLHRIVRRGERLLSARER